MTVQSDLGADHSEVYGSSENNAIQTHAPKDIRNHLNAPCYLDSVDSVIVASHQSHNTLMLKTVLIVVQKECE